MFLLITGGYPAFTMVLLYFLIILFVFYAAAINKKEGKIGLLSFARYNAIALIRGVRAISDFEYEFQIALMNRKLDDDVTTVFLMPHEKYTYLNSSIIRELARLHQDVSEFVPPYVVQKLKEKF